MFQLGRVDAAWFRLFGARLVFRHRSATSAKPCLNRMWQKQRYSPRWIVLELGSESQSYPVPISESGMGSLCAMTQTSHVLFPFRIQLSGCVSPSHTGMRSRRWQPRPPSKLFSKAAASRLLAESKVLLREKLPEGAAWGSPLRTSSPPPRDVAGPRGRAGLPWPAGLAAGGFLD